MNMLKDDKSDSELRIAAYRGVMECPTSEIISTVRQLLENEKTNQVHLYAVNQHHILNKGYIITKYRIKLYQHYSDMTFRVPICIFITILKVGSFIWTHISNLKSTSDPLKQQIRSILEDEPLKQTFNLDQRKFSRNYEGSFFMNSINTGAQVNTDKGWKQRK